MKRLTLVAVAVASVLVSAPAFAQYQGSNQSGDYALSWGAVHNGYGSFGNSYARYGSGRYYHRRH
jgi:hypothetical protein